MKEKGRGEKMNLDELWLNMVGKLKRVEKTKRKIVIGKPSMLKLFESNEMVMIKMIETQVRATTSL